MSEIFSRQAEFEALRATIRERGTARTAFILAGMAATALLALALVLGEVEGPGLLLPLLVLAATFETSVFLHTGVERVGRYIQVFYEERAGAEGWETIAMKYGAAFPGGLDPLFSIVFVAASLVSFLTPLVAATSRPGWIVVSLAAHLAFNYRIVRARRSAAAQRAIDLERFRSLISKA